MNKRDTPYSGEAEEAIIGLLLVRPGALDEAISAGLTASDFYTPKWAAAFDAVLTLASRGEAIDALTVYEAVKARGLDNPTGGELAAAIGERLMSLDHVRAYAGRAHGLAQLRKVLAASAEITERAYGPETK